MILKINNIEFQDFIFNERYLNNNNLEIYININYNDINEARKLLEEISHLENVNIKLLKDNNDLLTEYVFLVEDIYREIDIDNKNNIFRVIISYITSQN